jgi:hypothetical protein
MCLKRSKLAKPQVFDDATITSAPVTSTKPFNFTLKNRKQIRDFKSKTSKYVSTFLQQFAQNRNKLLKTLRPVPLKLMLKNISVWYSDKAQNAKDSKIIRLQTMAEYLYDLTFNKYGIPSLTDKKLKEILLSLELNMKKHSEIGLFKRFITGVYSNDDLSFYYKIIETVFETQGIQGKQLEAVLDDYFKDKISQQDLEEVKAEREEEGNEVSQICIGAIDSYISIKYRVYITYKPKIQKTIEENKTQEKATDQMNPTQQNATEGENDEYSEMFNYISEEQYFKILDAIDEVDHLKLRENLKTVKLIVNQIVFRNFTDSSRS